MLIPQLPRLAHQAMKADRLEKLEAGLATLLRQQQTRNRWLAAIAVLMAAMLALNLLV
jgi:ubiquinone biosynthesis protein